MENKLNHCKCGVMLLVAFWIINHPVETWAQYWNTTGNSGTTPGVNFVGTTDNQPLDFYAYNARALRLVVQTDSLGVYSNAPDVVGGSSLNSVGSGVVGATIGGGGGGNSIGVQSPNAVTADFGTVSGGNGNAAGQIATVGGGSGNAASGNYATVGGGLRNNASGSSNGYGTVSGGYYNTANGDWSTVGGGGGNIASGSNATVPGGNGNQAIADDATVGGGYANMSTALYATVGGGSNNNAGVVIPYYPGTAPGNYATVGGGSANTASGNYATVGGGSANTASGTYAMVLGGSGNFAIGSNSFAAGAQAYARDNGSFVWSDGSQATYSSGVNTFVVQATGGFQFLASTGGVTIFPNGTLTVPVLSITGGTDVAEPFEISGGKISTGSVVIIDDEHPGRLKLSQRPYDTRVAGVVSGANGIHPGIQMQQGLLAEGENVALSGRVYVRADASKCPIRPGDLLTTSSIPGHAMKVTDRAKAQGAILGKAMTGLSERSGMVLMLVTLQ